MDADFSLWTHAFRCSYPEGCNCDAGAYNEVVMALQNAIRERDAALREGDVVRIERDRLQHERDRQQELLDRPHVRQAVFSAMATDTCREMNKLADDLDQIIHEFREYVQERNGGSDG